MEEDAKSVEPKRLTPAKTVRHREIISRMVYHHQSVPTIAKELGMSVASTYVLVNTPMFQAELQKELTLKRKMERDAVIQSVADEGTKKLLEAVTTGKLVYPREDGEMEEKVL